MIIGFMLFFVMRAMGELLSNLEYKSFSDFAADLLGPGLAILPAGPTGSAGWSPGWRTWWRSPPTRSSGSRTLRLGRLAGGHPAAAGPNLATVKMFGEMEFWFAMIKIVAIVALIVVGLVMMMHFQSPTGVEASFAHLWNDGGWFPKGISGFFAGFQIAVRFRASNWWEPRRRKPKILREIAAGD
jgi:D-serine/D-alanine/glycine transporter